MCRMSPISRVLLAVLALGAIAAEGAQRPSSRAPVELLLGPYVATLRTIQVSVGDHTTPFIVDTGGGLTVLTPEVARHAGCLPFGRVTGFRATGERVDFQRCRPVVLKMGSLDVRTEAAILDLAPFLQGAPPVGGIISLHSLQGRAFTLDLRANRLILETPGSLPRRIRDASELSVRISRQAGGAALDLFLEAETAHGSIWLELDSGNAGPVMMSPHAITQLGVSLSADQPQRVILDVRGLSRSPVDAVMKDLIYDGVLNVAFLESIVLTVDVPSGRAWAVRRK
jgi:hypothetical protein